MLLLLNILVYVVLQYDVVPLPLSVLPLFDSPIPEYIH